MKKTLRFLGIALLILVVIGAGALAFLALKSPDMRPASSESIERTLERVARGEYLVRHVASCLACHSELMGDRFGSPIRPGTEGRGGFVFTKDFGIPGTVVAQNITPDSQTGIGAWTDGEVLRAIREGVDREGNALFPMMPYDYYRFMADEDAKAIVAYLRTLPPIAHQVPPKHIDFPINLFIKGAPKPVDGPIAVPDDAQDHLGYGRYLVTMAGCGDCHTPHDDHGRLIPGREFAGGWEMKGPWGRVITSNITPHPDTFMGQATKEDFIGRIKAFESLDGENALPATKGRNTIMPWLAYAGMTEQDLGAIYDFIKTVPPIANKIDPFPDAASNP